MITSKAQSPPPPPILLDELIVEILSWLPVKSLVQFRCVSKYFKSLISDPNFVKLHLERSARNPNLLLYRQAGYTSVVPFSVRSLLENPSSSTIAEHDCFRLNHDTGHFVVGSCNGLVCLYKQTHPFNDNNVEYRFCLCNPSTKLRSKYSIYLRVTSVVGFGFGFDNLSDTYKIVAFCFDPAVEESHKMQLKICSLGDNCWRNIPSFLPPPPPPPPPPSQEYCGGVYLNATLNWFSSRDDYNWSETARLVIVSLDLRTETYTKLLLPNCHDEAFHVKPTIGVLMGYLCFNQDYKRTHFVIWQMKEFGIENTWAQFMKVSYHDLPSDYFQFPFPVLPLSVSENGDDMIIATFAKAILYQRSDNRMEQVELPKSISWYHTKNYVESLVSPCCN